MELIKKQHAGAHQQFALTVIWTYLSPAESKQVSSLIGEYLLSDITYENYKQAFTNYNSFL